jgi:hypothetical protein
MHNRLTFKDSSTVMNTIQKITLDIPNFLP